MKSKTLILGGSGFVGSRLLSEVDQNLYINIDKNKSPFFNEITKIADVRDYESIKEYFIDVKTVVLLAAEHRDDVSPTKLYYDVNVEGAKNVLKSMDLFKVKNLIFTSSVAVYGLNKENPSENHEINPFNHYGKSKWAAEEVIKEWYDSDTLGKSVTILRPTVIFGERNRGNVYNLLKQIASGKFLMIGKGENKKSMCYVGNVVAFLQDVIKENKKGYQVFNFVDKPDFTMNELVKQVEVSLRKKIPSLHLPVWLGMLTGYGFDIFTKLTKRKTAISSVRVKKFCATTQFDASKLNAQFVPPYSLEDGLDKTLKFEFSEKNKDNVVFYTE